MSDNLELWNDLKSVNAEFLKQVPGGAKLTSVDPQWRMRRMTEVFGPVGVGWGWEVVKRWREDFGATGVVYASVKVWYSTESQGIDNYGQSIRVWTGEYTGGTVAKKQPDEAYKMAETDAMGKCCASIGLAADVYMGQHTKTAEYAPDFMIEEIQKLVEETPKAEERRLLNKLGISSWSEMTIEQANQAKKLLKDKADADN